jgi:hypothetical protein
MCVGAARRVSRGVACMVVVCVLAVAIHHFANRRSQRFSLVG